jgi:hypothetical protein
VLFGVLFFLFGQKFIKYGFFNVFECFLKHFAQPVLARLPAIMAPKPGGCTTGGIPAKRSGGSNPIASRKISLWNGLG